MNKLWIAICIIIFITVTIIAVSIDNPNYGRKVRFSTVNFKIQNDSNNLVTNNTKIIKVNNSTVKETTIQTNTTNLSSKIEHTPIKNYETEVNTYKTSYDKKSLTYKNLDDSKLDEILNSTKNKKYNNKNENQDFIQKYKNVAQEDEDETQYGYNDVDWGRWKSNFVNKILDDSLSLRELDNYPNGAFFYYSFIVDYEGRISNISVRSLYLSDSDKQLITDFIKHYEHKPITRFPSKSKRKTARISAIIMLSNSETKYSKPNDFRDTERIKYQIK